MMLSLWLIIVLAVMAYSLTHELHVGLRMTGHAQRRAKARAIARAGMARAVLDIKNDRLLQAGLNQILLDTPHDIYFDNEAYTEVPFGGGSYTVRVVDENRKINVNNLSPISARAIDFLVEDLSDYDTEQISTLGLSIIDYVDKDLKATFGIDSNNERDNYTEWALDNFGNDLPFDYVFRPKNDLLINIEELMELPGITRELMFGNPEDMPLDSIERIDMDEPSTALIDYLTVDATVTNVNTIEPLTLTAMITAVADDPVMAEGMTETFMDWRENLDEFRDDGTIGISNLAQLQDSGINPDIVNNVRSLFNWNVYSDVYTIVARGEYEGVRKTLYARVQVFREAYPIDPDNPDTLGERDSSVHGWLESQPNVKFDPAVRVLRTWEL